MYKKIKIKKLKKTWNPEHKKQTFIPPIIEGYHNYIGTNGLSAKGGCGFYINDSLNSMPRKDLNIKLKDDNNEFESCWVEIINDKEPNILLGVFYRHTNKKDTKFTVSLLATLKKIRKENKKIIISGDFNFDLLQHEKNEEIDIFLNSMLGNNLQACIT